MDVADACHARGIKTVAVTAGYMHDQPRQDFYSKIDAANVDLKSFSEDFYSKISGAHLLPVLDTLKYLAHKTSVWLEITTLIIPGKNDSEEELRALSSWIFRELGADVPLHFSAFHPDYKMPEVPQTPLDTLVRARSIAIGEGLHYVYTGNIHNVEGDTTYCPECHLPVIVRDWYEINQYKLLENGVCPLCGATIAGRFDAKAGTFGRNRIPVSMKSAETADA